MGSFASLFRDPNGPYTARQKLADGAKNKERKRAKTPGSGTKGKFAKNKKERKKRAAVCRQVAKMFRACEFNLLNLRRFRRPPCSAIDRGFKDSSQFRRGFESNVGSSFFSFSFFAVVAFEHTRETLAHIN